MSDIPGDVMEAAQAVVDDINLNDVSAAPAIARAILAERERCAKEIARLRRERDEWKIRWQNKADAFEVQEQTIATTRHALSQARADYALFAASRKKQGDHDTKIIEGLMDALTEIADSDDTENALDPQRNKRVALAALPKAPSRISG